MTMIPGETIDPRDARDIDIPVVPGDHRDPRDHRDHPHPPHMIFLHKKMFTFYLPKSP